MGLTAGPATISIYQPWHHLMVSGQCLSFSLTHIHTAGVTEPICRLISLPQDAGGVTLGLMSHGWKCTDKADGDAASGALSPLQVWNPFTLPRGPPTAGSTEPERRGRGQTGGQDRRVRAACSKQTGTQCDNTALWH